MTAPQRIEKCPCGSGKPAHLCCESEKARHRKMRLIVVSSLAVVAFGAVIALAVSTADDWGRAPRATQAVTPIPTYTPSDGSAPTAAPTGGYEPYSYDPVANKHWDPAHQHWHSGPPPAGQMGPTVTAPPDTSDVGLTETIPNPEPWQYDPLTDQHWHAEHGHWHSGRPPANAGGTTPVVPVTPVTDTP